MENHVLVEYLHYITCVTGQSRMFVDPDRPSSCFIGFVHDLISLNLWTI